MTAGHSAILQAGCVAIAGRAILIEGPPGSGKSSLALALIDRGAGLVGDDGVVLSCRAGQLWAAPHPITRGLLEVRNLGIIRFACLAEARVCLKLRLDPAAPRHIDHAPREWVGGAEIPAVRMWPGSDVLALRAELALSHYGLE
ncbi:MAG: HPr kinase/phosphatase C-terminal domain-containing protein [Pseudomonadota bacterium]|nr:HPr kinase/phosphatase C-terminal domain-containing protein [Pseudomonadota bacterium]